jgi:hypothetical protein
VIVTEEGTRWWSGLRHCATSRKVAGYFRDGVIFPDAALGPWGRPSLTEISTRDISWREKTAGALGRRPYLLHVATV